MLSDAEALLHIGLGMGRTWICLCAEHLVLASCKQNLSTIPTG